MLMHISCIRTFSFLSLFYLVIMFFLASPSLSLSDRLRMAPSANLLQIGTLFHSGSSSSFDLPPLHVRFCDEKAHQDFSENFSKRGVL